RDTIHPKVMKFSKTTILFSIATLLVGFSTAQNEPPRTLKIGMDVPPVQVGKAIKGTAITKIEKGKVYVLSAFT
ncbi:hypothetical protein ACEV7Z_23355, partial [Vibrio parahaemolyticus]